MRILACLALFCLAVPAEEVQVHGSVQGRIVNQEKQPVVGALVRFAPGGRQSVTDAKGEFRVAELPLARLVMTVTARGYFSGAQMEVDLLREVSMDVEAVLQRESVLEQSVVVTGSGTQSLLVEAPVRTELVSRSYVEQQAVRNLSEALTASVPGLRVENNCQNCGWTAIRLNGLEGAYTQLLEDGLPTVSGASMVYALDQLPTEFFENIEVVKGGASSLYGPNAVAGVINMVRREPEHTRFQVDGQLGSYQGRPEQSAGFVGQVDELWRGWAADFYYRGHHRTHNDLDRDGFTELTRRAANAGGGTMFRRFLNGQARLSGGASAVDDFRRGGSQLDVPPEQTYITEQVNSVRSAGFVRWNHTVNPSLYYNLSSSLSHLRRKSYYGAGFDPNAYGTTNNPLSTSDTSMGYQAGRHTISAGFQFWHEQISDVYEGYNRDTRQTFRNGGFYVQDEWRVNSRLTMLGGVRADKSNLLDHWILSPRGNVRVGLTNQLNLRVGVSTGFRPPQVFDEDLHIAAVGGEAMLIRYATGLKQESSRSLTTALDYVGRWAGRPAQVGASFFWTRLNDVFQLREVPGTVDMDRIMERTNGPGSHFRGIEFNAKFQPMARVSVRGGATLQQARYDVPEPIFGSVRYFRTPNQYGFAGLDLELPGGVQWLNSLELTGPMILPHYAGYIAEDRIDRSGTFGVWSVVLSRTWRLNSSDHHSLRLYLRGNNLLNSFQKDFDQGPNRDSTYVYGPMAPRGFVGGVTFFF